MTVPTTTKILAPRSGPLLLFGGAYSNLQALRALRAEAERRGIPPGNVICTGDTPGYCADPAACLDLLQEWATWRVTWWRGGTTAAAASATVPAAIYSRAFGTTTRSGT